MRKSLLRSLRPAYASIGRQAIGLSWCAWAPSTPVARPKGLGWQGWSRHPLLFHLQCTLPHQWQQDSSALSSGASCYPSRAAIGSNAEALWGWWWARNKLWAWGRLSCLISMLRCLGVSSAMGGMGTECGVTHSFCSQKNQSL